MGITDRISVLFGKLAGKVIERFHLGAGATWPGELVLRIRPRIIEAFLSEKKHVILVAGTNGKTTTVKMLETILRQAGYSVIRNASGANLDNGIASVLINDFSLSGHLRSDYFIFEVDEASLPKILRFVTPDVIVLLNLFRDQLDRYGEIDTIARNWRLSLTSLPEGTRLVVNADDPFLTYISEGNKLHKSYFGLENPKLGRSTIEHAADSTYCPRCGRKLTYGVVYFSHLGKWACGKCDLTHPDVKLGYGVFKAPIEGIYNIYNTLAAALSAEELGVTPKIIEAGLNNFTPAFGRMERITYHGVPVRMVLSKNPAGFNESLRTFVSSESKGPVLLLLNDRIPDGTDVSWIWDVDFEMLKGISGKIYVSGDRFLDLGVRLKYAGFPLKQLQVMQYGKQAIDKAVSTITHNEELWILSTYTAMLDARKILTGRKIL